MRREEYIQPAKELLEYLIANPDTIGIVCSEKTFRSVSRRTEEWFSGKVRLDRLSRPTMNGAPVYFVEEIATGVVGFFDSPENLRSYLGYAHMGTILPMADIWMSGCQKVMRLWDPIRPLCSYPECDQPAETKFENVDVCYRHEATMTDMNYTATLEELDEVKRVRDFMVDEIRNIKKSLDRLLYIAQEDDTN